jgi:hypothetical protein
VAQFDIELEEHCILGRRPRNWPYSGLAFAGYLRTSYELYGIQGAPLGIAIANVEKGVICLAVGL